MRYALTTFNNLENSLECCGRDLTSVFDELFYTTPFESTYKGWLPSADIRMDKDAIHVTAEIPGVDEKDLTVNIQNNVLTITGERKEENYEDNADVRYIVSERSYGSFSRSIALPEGVAADAINAVFKNGVLHVTIPKGEKMEPKKISIKVN